MSEFYKEYIEGNIVKAEAEAKAKTAESVSSAKTDKDGYTFLEFFQVWLEAIKPTVAENTYEGYIHTSHRIISYFDKVYPGIMLTELTAMELQHFYNDMYAGGT